MKTPGMLVIGAGFLGTALARRLSLCGLSVHVLSPDPQGVDAERIHVYRGGLEDESLVEGLVSRCSTVVHAASATTPGSSASDPVTEGTGNLLPTLKLLSVLQRHPGRHLVYLSSGGCVYGDPPAAPLDEAQPLRPRSYHGAGKIAAEAFLHAFSTRSSAEQPVTILRPSNLYGPGQALREGFGLVRTLLEKFRTGAVLDIWGDGETVRDFLYIDDLVEACMRFIALPQDNDIYNIASGHSCSINQLIEIASRVCGRPLQVRYHPARHTDVRAVVLDTRKLQERLGWAPAVSLEEGIARTWQWLNTQ
jgi:UDP-glucose 4-epimerase